MRKLRVAGAAAGVLLAATLAAGASAAAPQQPKTLPGAPTQLDAATAPATDSGLAPRRTESLRDLPLRRDAPGESAGPPWIAIVGLLVLAAAALVLVLRRHGPGSLFRALPMARGGGTIERVASQPLTPQASVHAVRWHGEELLLGCTAAQVTVLARRPARVAGDAT